MLSIAIKPDGDCGRVVMSAETHHQLGSPNTIELHFGHLKQSMLISIDSAVETDEIHIPARLSEQITLPVVPFEVRVEGHALHLGPLIGFMNNILFYDNPHWIKTRFAKISEIKGLVVIFSPRHVDPRRRLISGIYYDPGSDSFREVTIPYPPVIYLRTDPPVKLYRHLKNQLGARNIYNYPFRSNKWEFWHYARQYPEVRGHLPETREYVSLEGVLDMLRRHSAVYLKPYTLSRGRGIYRLCREGHGYHLSDSHGRVWIVGDKTSLEQLLGGMLRRNYLVQQEIPFMHQGRKVDYRIYLQKNREGEWEYRGMDTRIAVKGSIISNLRKRYETLTIEDGLQMAYGLDMTAVEEKIAEITKVCIKALEPLEGNGYSLGDVALDIVLDENQKVWLLEVQADYSADVFKIREQYYAATIHPHCFDYAKTLAGF